MHRQTYKFSDDIKNNLKKLTRLDNFHGPLAVIEDFFVISCAILAFWISPYFYPISVLLIGSRQRALATLLHESAHKTLCRNKTLNYLLGTTFSGHLIFQMSEPYFRSHVLNHHRHLGNAETDPDLIFHISEGLYAESSPTKFKWNFLIKPWLFLNITKQIVYVFSARFRPGRIAKTPAYRSELCRFLILWTAISIALTISGVWIEFLLLWIIPYLTVFQAVNWYCELSEHFPIPSATATDIHMTRNRFSPPWERFFFGVHGENCHLEHHLHPGIPFWNLAAANAARRKDEHYDRLNSAMGGLLVRSKTGAQSAVSSILESVRKGA
ncbi:guanitoxin biosynthesis L-arginine gamma (S) hydroxylase [Achromobacter spanius]|uniref:guanitoxin biosynthesis L-arginine gamma (S) hydroxylase n=1 Tax=Achromobacter spanius TaxID=217203 RepID=UPI0037F62456